MDQIKQQTEYSLENLESLREEFQSGNMNRLQEIYLEYHDDIVRIVKSKKLCDPAEVEGYFNECMIQFYEGICDSKILNIKSLKNLLVGICINLILREKDSRLRVEKKIDNVRLHLYEKYDHPSNDDNKAELIHKVKNEMKKLSDRCVKIITSYYINNLTMSEIANQLELSSGDVAKTLKSRCFKKLLTLIKLT